MCIGYHIEENGDSQYIRMAQSFSLGGGALTMLDMTKYEKADSKSVVSPKI